MAMAADRVGELVEGVKRNRRVLITPEGVPLDIRIAGHGERLVAFVIDISLLFGVVLCLYFLADLTILASDGESVGMTILLFLSFIARTCYFLHFELAWQGRTPGKKVCGLRVINREGGELTPSAIIARNLTREAEFFLPMSLFLSLDPGASAWRQLALLGWALAITSLPLWGSWHLRAGDVVGGTQVISMPARVLLGDLAQPLREKEASGPPVFTPEQLGIYGAFELQVLEEFLRRPETMETERLLREVCGKICRKIGWEEAVPAEKVRRFLTDFYTAEREELERGQRFGRYRADKAAGRNAGRR